MQAATQTTRHLCSETAEHSLALLSPTTYVGRFGGLGGIAPQGRRRPRLSLSDGSAVRVIDQNPMEAVSPSEARMTVLHGDPARPELFIVRFRVPAGFEVAPHAHPTAEFITVVSGTLLVRLEDANGCVESIVLSAGDFLTVPAGRQHQATALVTSVVQLDAVGPFDLTYVHRATAPKGMRR